MPRYRLLRDIVQPGRSLLAGVTLDTEADHPLFRIPQSVVGRWLAEGWVEALPDPDPPHEEHGWGDHGTPGSSDPGRARAPARSRARG